MVFQKDYGKSLRVKEVVDVLQPDGFVLFALFKHVVVVEPGHGLRLLLHLLLHVSHLQWFPGGPRLPPFQIGLISRAFSAVLVVRADALALEGSVAAAADVDVLLDAD